MASLPASTLAGSGSKASFRRRSMHPTRRNRGLWRKPKCLNRQEFVVVGWTDPEGSRPHLGALLLGYYTDDGKLIYAGRVGTGMPDKVLADLRRLEPLARASSPLSVPPPRDTRFMSGSDRTSPFGGRSRERDSGRFHSRVDRRNGRVTRVVGAVMSSASFCAENRVRRP